VGSALTLAGLIMALVLGVRSTGGHTGGTGATTKKAAAGYAMTTSIPTTRNTFMFMFMFICYSSYISFGG
jgi:hypothetical protein